MLTVLSRVEQINEESGTSYEILINDSIEKSREKITKEKWRPESGTRPKLRNVQLNKFVFLVNYSHGLTRPHDLRPAEEIHVRLSFPITEKKPVLEAIYGA